MEDAFMFICIGVLLTGVFSLCNKDYITKEEYDYAQHLCVSANSDIEKVGFGIGYTTVCKNGAEFTFTHRDYFEWSKHNENKN